MGLPEQFEIGARVIVSQLGMCSGFVPTTGVEKSIHTAGHQRLAEILRVIRTDQGLRQVDVAERLHEPQSFVAKYESGERRLDLVELDAVATALGIQLADLVSRWSQSG